MAKRKSDSDDDSPHKKRQRITKDLASEQDSVKIQTFRDLQQLLTFEQDAGPHVRQKLQCFKSFLESIAYGKESDERSARRLILLEYLQSQTPDDGEDSLTHVADLVRIWNFAAQANVESLFSSVVAVLALLIKTISSLIEFRTYGNHLCKVLLRGDQIKLFDRGLGVSKAKEHLISPCLRLLTEITSFDGGHSAIMVFRQRDITFKRLEVFLGMRKAASVDDFESRRKPSIRNNALRFLYSNLRLQGPAAKTYILAQGKVVRAVFEEISEDSRQVILELLEVLKKDVASDSAMSHIAKSRFFNEWVLGRIASLYYYLEAEVGPEERLSVQHSTHALLLFLCTSPGHGVLDTQARDGTAVKEAESVNDLEREPSFEDSYRTDKQSVGRNTRLSLFLQSLRPHANVLQGELILAVFRTAPEMLSDYFGRRKSFSFDPKATATWIGYSSFLIATMRMPITVHFRDSIDGNSVPPHYSSIIDSIMPEPLTQKVMTRCLNQNMDLIKYLSTNMLIAAFEKLAEVLRIYRGRHRKFVQDHNSIHSSRAGHEIINEFCSRIPDVAHVIAQLRGCSPEKTLLRESLNRLLALYYVVTPQVALEAKFDVSVALSAALQTDGMSVESRDKNGVRILELDHILDIARHSPSMQWWHKSEKMSLSPFTALLKLYVNRWQAHSDSRQLRTLLVSTIEESQVLDCSNSRLSLDVLAFTLQDSENWKAASAVYEFLDECVIRFVRKPVHYYDALSSLVGTADSANEMTDVHIDLLLVAIMEQWPFLVIAPDRSTTASVATWLVRYLEMSWLRVRNEKEAGLDRGSVIRQIRDHIKTATKDKICRSLFKRTLNDPSELGLSLELVTSTIRKNEQDQVEKPTSAVESDQSQPCVVFAPSGPPQEHEDHPGLNRWTREDISDAISDGAVEELLLCLCSKYKEIRHQAITSVGAFMAKLEASGYTQWQQTYVVAGELSETAKEVTTDTPLPYFAAVLATRLLLVVAYPLHTMYEKANRFLHKGPRWNVTKLPSYWVDKILLNPPTGDSAHYQEAEWLLDALIDGLRTPADFEVYRGCRIIERLLSLSASPSLPEPCQQKIVALLFRCTYVEGSSTLITRCGLIGWIASRLTLDADETTKNRLRLLASRVYQTSDQERIIRWSHGTLSDTIDSLRISKIQ